MNWQRISGDTIGAEGYRISRYQQDGEYRFTVRAPDGTDLGSYWGQDADEAKRLCEEHAKGRGGA